MLYEPAARSVSTVPFVDRLECHGDRAAVLGRDLSLTYAELAQRVEAVAATYGGGRKLVMITGANDLAAIVGYLAALRGGHVAMLVAGDDEEHLTDLVGTYDPDVVVRRVDGSWHTEHRHAEAAHELHPELAVLLSTSGSTGSAKMVRLSHRNLQANAEAIAEYLSITEGDRAITTLPMHYCYGLSVLHSHLLQGAALVLTSLSVVDRCFWDDARAFGVTSFAGVPYTFDLLDRIGFETMSLPTLRYVTQAGGRLEPERVRRYAELGRRQGWDLFVMYGQTEATARMAYLPPHLARSHPGAIGVPIPGGSFTLVPVDDDRDGAAVGPSRDESDGGEPDEGELVYRGPNVMLGYATGPADLARGRDVHELRTGDIARRTADGLYEIVGRKSRFVKLFGLRIDLEQVERVLAAASITALCAGDDQRLVVAVADGTPPQTVRDLTKQRFGLPPTSVVVLEYPELPRLPNGKPDRVAVTARARAECANRPTVGDAPVADDTVGSPLDVVRSLYAEVLQRRDIGDDDTFVGLGGDSLSYVELSVRLEKVLGHLPAGWHTTPLRDLTQVTRRRALRQIETNVLLRAVAIVLIVGNHTRYWYLQGGAHVLLAVAGFNFARFQLAPSEHDRRSSRIVATAARVAVPSMLWIGLMVWVMTDYHWPNAVLMHGILGSDAWDERWRYWYLEVLVQLLVVFAVLFAVPAVRRFERRHGFAFAIGLLAVGLALRFGALVGDDVVHRIYRPHTVGWVFVLGWAAHRAVSAPQKLLVSALVLLSVPGYFEEAPREVVIVVGLLALLWLPNVVVPWPLNRVAGVLAAASLYIYLTHPQTYPPVLDRSSPWAAFAVSLVGGIIAHRIANKTTAALSGLRAGASRPRRVTRVAPTPASPG